MNKLKKVVPNMITFSRIITLVFGFVFFLKGKSVLALSLYIYGSVSDFFDGYLARRWNAYTKLGSYLDAISDKFYTLSIIILSLINGNYLIIVVAILELIITVVNYMVIKNKVELGTVRVGKFKMTFEFMLLIVSLIAIRIKYLYSLFVLLFVLTVYFQIQSINAYINKKNKKKMELFIDNNDYIGKTTGEKIKLMFNEFKYYLFNPVKIIK